MKSQSELAREKEGEGGKMEGEGEGAKSQTINQIPS